MAHGTPGQRQRGKRWAQKEVSHDGILFSGMS
jgi:hypothetical protein